MKILIVHATAGNGHKRAAEAVYGKLCQLGKAEETQIIDVLDYTSGMFKWSYPRVYIFLVKHLSFLWAFSYYALEIKFLFYLLTPFRILVNHLHSAKFIKFLKETNPDYIVSTHFFPVEVARHLVDKGEISSKIVTVVTDFCAHNIWVFKQTHKYFVAFESTKAELVRKGIDADKITVSGIPIVPVFENTLDKEALTSALGLDKDKRTVLVGGGGFGVGPIEKVVNLLLEELDVQVIVVCGHDASLKEKLEETAASCADRLKVFGFINNMEEMMEISDIIVTKSGGLTSSESLAKNLPMVLLKPIPGQEAYNAARLVSEGAAIKCADVDQIQTALKKLLNDNMLLDKMTENARRLARPKAADTIARNLLA